MTTVVPFVSRSTAADAERWLDALRKAMPETGIQSLPSLTSEQRAEARVAIVADPDPNDLLQLPQLRWIHSLWAGVERLVSEMPDDSDVAIVRLEDPQMAKTMAEAVLAWSLYLHRDMPRYRRQQEERVWREHDLPLPSERTIGILGLGQLGQAAARVLSEQGFDVCGWNRSGTEVAGVTTHGGKEGLQDVLAASHIVVVLMPLTPETRGLLDSSAFSAMREGASLINFARGPIVHDDALLAALDSGHLDHAVLDVFASEPLPADSRYWSHPSVTVLPHISAPTNRTTASRIVADNLRGYFATGEIPPAVDRDKGY